MNAKQRNNEQIKILQEQIDVYNDYLSSNGESFTIRIDRHMDTMPDYIVVLGDSGGGLVTGIGGLLFLGRPMIPAGQISRFLVEVLSKRFMLAGVATIIVSSVGAYFLKRHLDHSLKNRARTEMIRQLDASHDDGIQTELKALMVKQLFDLVQTNQIIDQKIKQLASMPNTARKKSSL